MPPAATPPAQSSDTSGEGTEAHWPGPASHEGSAHGKEGQGRISVSLRKAVAGLLVVAAGVAGWMQGAPREADVEDSGEVASEATRQGVPLLRRLWPAMPEGGLAGERDVAALLAEVEGLGERGLLEGLDATDRSAGPAPQPPAEAAELPREDAAPDEGGTQPAGQSVPVRFYTHRVRQGETLWDIARQYRTDVNAIATANGLYDVDYIRPGQVLEVPSVPGVVHTVQRGETLWEISRIYGVSMQAIQEANGLASPDVLLPSTRLIIPGATGPVLDRLVVGGRLQRAFSWPVRGRISSRFGWRWGRQHEGVDIAVPTGTPVRAAAPGRVVFAGWGGGYGYLISIDHGSGVVTRYAHNSRLVVRVGQRVARGQIVAYSGNTGNSTGPHVHFEIRYRGRAVDPLPYLR